MSNNTRVHQPNQNIPRHTKMYNKNTLKYNIKTNNAHNINRILKIANHVQECI